MDRITMNLVQSGKHTTAGQPFAQANPIRINSLGVVTDAFISVEPPKAVGVAALISHHLYFYLLG